MSTYKNFKLPVIGKGLFNNFDTFIAWYEDEMGKSRNEHSFTDDIDVDKYESRELRGFLYDFFDKSFRYYEVDKLRELNELIVELEQKYNVIFDNGVILIIGSGDEYFVIPASCKEFQYTPFKNYDNASIGQLRTLTANGGIANTVKSDLPATTTPSRVREGIGDQKAAIEALKSEYAEIENNKTAELSKLEAELKAAEKALNDKKKDLMEVLNAKRAEMTTMLRNMEAQLFMLDSEIYSIRCFLGETVDFVQLRKGVSANDTTPVTLFQKMHYLDEDLARLVSLYSMDDSLEYAKSFEKAISFNDRILETFCPNNKCVSLVKISRSGTIVSGADGSQILKRYELIHGKMIGILIRDGENLYMGWTDDTRISIPDDMFCTTVREDGSEKKIEDMSETEAWEKTCANAKEIASRYFLFSILQGVIESKTPLLKFSEKPSIFSESPMVAFSAADNWIEDKRYGTFNDIVKKCNGQINEGDHILLMLSLAPKNAYDYNFGFYHNENDRGRGYANRTHDCSVKDCVIYQINLIETHVYSYWLIAESDDKHNTYTGDDGIRYAHRMERKHGTEEEVNKQF